VGLDLAGRALPADCDWFEYRERGCMTLVAD
jgi:hypothetical protein